MPAQKNRSIDMPKMKTNSSAKKRFKVTASGKIKFKHAFKNHILTKKTHKRKKQLGKAAYVHTSDVGRVEALLVM